MIAQGVLPFRYENEPTASGMTALAGLPPYLDLGSVRRNGKEVALSWILESKGV